ncbi:MAG: DNA primase [Epsilonproteobacteria bacterium]|nr:MAG: DNA primase [Campylobacterota bacterium]
MSNTGFEASEDGLSNITGDASGQEPKTFREIENTSIAEKTSPLEKLSESIQKVNLINTLEHDIRDPLHKYRKEDDYANVDNLKIPNSLYIVAIIHEIFKVAKRIKLGICVKHGAIYMYDGKYWSVISDEEIKSKLSSMTIKLGFYSPATALTADFSEKLFKQFIKCGIDEGIPQREGKSILINLNNGTLEIDSGNVKLRDHNRNDFLTYVLQYDYDEEAIAPIFDNFINKVLPDTNSSLVLQEFLGYVFTTNLKLEKALILYGGGANGKSVLFEVVSKLMGRDNISSMGLGDICSKGDKGNNYRAGLENKLINFSSEINSKGVNTDIFKALVSGEPVSARRLYKDGYELNNNAKMIFNANELPRESDRSHGFFRRFIIIPFEVTISEKEQDIRLPNKIIAKELSGVLNWIIAGLIRVLENGKFTQSNKVDNAHANFKREANSVLQFIEEYQIVKNDYEFASTRDLYNTYSEYCNGSGYHRLSKDNFSKELVKAGFEKMQRKVGGKNQRGFKSEFGE